MHDLAGVEDDRLAAWFSVMPRKRSIRMLQAEEPVDHAMRPAGQVGAFKNSGSFNEGLDNVAGGLGIPWQPTLVEAPARRHAACVGSLIENILRHTEPIQRRVEMCLIITGRGISRSPGDIPKDQPEMTEPPWLIAIKASDRASGAAVHHDFALQRSRRGTVVTTIADAAVNIPQSPCLCFEPSTVFG